MSDVTDIAALRRDARTERFFGEMELKRADEVRREALAYLAKAERLERIADELEHSA